jgi:hypothetical protein
VRKGKTLIFLSDGTSKKDYKKLRKEKNYSSDKR